MYHGIVLFRIPAKTNHFTPGQEKGTHTIHFGHVTVNLSRSSPDRLDPAQFPIRMDRC